MTIGGADGNETTEVQVTSASSLGVGALYQQRSWCGFDLGVLVRCNQADATPQRVAKVADALATSSSVPLQGHPPIAAAGDDGGTEEAVSVDGGGDSAASALPSQGVQGQGVLGDADTLPYVQGPSDTYTQFFDGYRAGAGQYPEERIDAMIFCESSWRIDPGGWHLGLAQFDPGTWATVSTITGFADWLNPWHQGYNVAVWASMISPGTSAGWPSCFYAIDW